MDYYKFMYEEKEELAKLKSAKETRAQRELAFAYVEEHTELVSSTSIGDYTTFKSTVYCIMYRLCYRCSVYTVFPSIPQVEGCLYSFRSSSLCS